MDPIETWEEKLQQLRLKIRSNLSNQIASNFKIKTYDDKNAYLIGDEISYGNKLFSNRRYHFSELFWEEVLKETRDFKTKNPGVYINVGLPLENVGISLIAQGKIFDGIIFLFNAYDNDKETLEMYKIGSIDPFQALITSPLYLQFKNTIINKLGRNRSRSKKRSEVKIVKYTSKIQDLFTTLNPSNNIHLFYILAEIDEALTKAHLAYRHTEIISPKLIHSFLQLAMFLESRLKLKPGSPNGELYSQLEKELKRIDMSYTMDKGFLQVAGVEKPKTSLELETAIELIQKSKTRTLIERKCLTVYIIRNYYAHNATDYTLNLFIKKYIHYTFWLLDLVVQFLS